MSIGFGSILLTFIIVFSLTAQASGEFSTTDKIKLIKFVNVFRANLATRKPPAANLQEVFWDEKLATLARRDVVQCGKGAPPKPSIGGVAIFLRNNSSIEDLMKCLRQDLVTRPYLIKATFNRMGCALNTSCCGAGYSVLCYWYPLCGNLYNAYEEGPLACSEFRSMRSKNYKQLCVRSCAEEDLDICSHKTRSKAIVTEGFVPARIVVAIQDSDTNGDTKSDSKSGSKSDSKSGSKSDSTSGSKSDSKSEREEETVLNKDKMSVMKLILW